VSVATPRIKRIAHIVLYVRDPERSAKWYADVLGMIVTARVSDGPYRGGVFMSFGVADHDIGLFPASVSTNKGQEFEHVGLEVDCTGQIDGLKLWYGKLLKSGVEVHEILDHGVSKGIYFFEPDGHMLEVFCQLTPSGPAAIAEISENCGKADPIEMTPLNETE
jgi:catechol 2,3-dioxygenase-like lactoylglutathione lyase family enzyme